MSKTNLFMSKFMDEETLRDLRDIFDVRTEDRLDEMEDRRYLDSYDDYKKSLEY